jgi:NhaP-type Na+/H+ or K+/H+ antiporter
MSSINLTEKRERFQNITISTSFMLEAIGYWIIGLIIPIFIAVRVGFLYVFVYFLCLFICSFLYTYFVWLPNRRLLLSQLNK